MFDILRTWCAEKKDGNAETAEFIALAEKISGQQLDELFTAGRPAVGPNGEASARTAAVAEPKSIAKIRYTHELLAAHD